METYSHRASDLTPEMKRAVEGLMGRKLGDEEVITLKPCEPHTVQGTQEREQLLREMQDLRRQMREKIAPGVTQEALEAALDEACAEVRYGPRG